MRWSCVWLVLGFVGAALMATAPALAVPFTLEIWASTARPITRRCCSRRSTTRISAARTPVRITTECSATDLAYSNGGYTALRITGIQLDLDNDPLVDGNIAVSNEQGFTQRFTFIFNLPITPIPGTTIQSGSISGSVADGFEGDGATISAPAGESIYQARIDGVDTNSLHATPRRSRRPRSISPASRPRRSAPCSAVRPCPPSSSSSTSS